MVTEWWCIAGPARDSLMMCGIGTESLVDFSCQVQLAEFWWFGVSLQHSKYIICLSIQNLLLPIIICFIKAVSWLVRPLFYRIRDTQYSAVDISFWYKFLSILCQQQDIPLLYIYYILYIYNLGVHIHKLFSMFLIGCYSLIFL